MNEIATLSPVALQSLNPGFAPFVKHLPDCTVPFLRYQILVKHRRSSLEPIYEGGHLLGYKQGPVDTYVKLLGFGETLEAAKEMVRRWK